MNLKGLSKMWLFACVTIYIYEINKNKSLLNISLRFSFLTDLLKDDNDGEFLRSSGCFAHNTGQMYLTEFLP